MKRRKLNENHVIKPGVVPFKGNDGTYDRFLIVYEIHCKRNDTYYIGQHRCKVTHEDPTQDSYCGSGQILQSMKSKYSWYDDFTFTIIEFCKDLNELSDREQYWILQYRDKYQDRCINILEGKYDSLFRDAEHPIVNLNNGKVYRNRTEMSRDLNFPDYSIQTYLSKRKRFPDGCFYQRQAVIDLTSIEEELKLCELAEIDLLKRKAANAYASKLRHQRGIVNLTTGEEFDSIIDAARKYRCARGSLKQACEHHWKVFDCFWQFKDIVEQTSIEQQLAICEQSQRHNMERQRSIVSNLSKSKCRPVINLNTGEEYESAVAASKAIGVDESSVGVAIRKQVRCKGFYWELKSVVEQKGRENLLQQYQQAKIDNLEQYHATRRKKVVCIDDGTVYESLRALAKAVGCHTSTVDGGLKHHRRIKGKYYKYLEQ